MNSRTPWKLAVAASVAASVLLTAGCGDDGSGDGSSGGDTGSGGGAVVDVAAAQASIEPLTAPPTEFPVTEPLAQRPEPGTTVAFLDVGTPTTAKVYEELNQAAEAMGVELQRVQTGQSPQEINAAMNTLVEARPDAVIDIAVDPALWTPQLEQLQEQGTVVVLQSVVSGEQFGFDDEQIAFGAAGSKAFGSALASAVLAETDGEATELVFYRIPELTFTPLIQEGVEERLEEQCPDCELRVVDISIAEVGSTASRTIVSDLQANPETDAFIVSVDELQIGLPAAMQVAGMDVQGMGIAPTPLNLQQIADGQQLGSLATDFKFLSWLAMDQAARGLAGQEFDYAFATEADPAISQIITADNVPADPEEGYVAFPDYQEQFSQLWAGQ